MQGIELVESRLFKVVKIVDRDGVEKHQHSPQNKVYNKFIRIMYRLEEGETTFLRVADSREVVTTSMVEHYKLTEFAGMPTRLTIKTLNTIYILDEVLAVRILGGVDYGIDDGSKAFINPIQTYDKELTY